MEQEAAGFTHRRKDKLPKDPFSNIAISLSGGGFRATAFHLGMLTYLSSKSLFGKSFLERTRILSTASAGTFTGVKYATTLKKGGTLKEAYKSLYDFMRKRDLVTEALEYLAEDANWKDGKQPTLINAFAAIYYKEFEQENFSLLWDEKIPIHLKEISFNATEFNFAMPFRFQKNERLSTGHVHEHIGNKKIHIPIEVAKEIRFSDIIAASSCFPFGFEPMKFPDDFIYEDAVKLKDHSLLPKHVYDGDKINYPIAIMDGSIDDNQGVDAVVIAEERMKQYEGELREFRSDDEKAVDLYIISDVSPSNMESYESKTEKIPGIDDWHFNSVKTFGIVCAILGIGAIFLAFFFTSKTVIIAFSILGTLQCLIAFFLLLVAWGLTSFVRRIGIPEFVVQRFLHVDNLKFGTLYNMIISRKKSTLKLISEVFIKHMRWFSYERVYGDPNWRPRLIMNAAFELTEDEVEKRKKKYPFLSKEISEPGAELILVASIASSMDTTLWFDKKDLEGKRNKLDSLIACGQFTTCFNLLKYFEKFLKNEEYKNEYNKYSDETKAALDQLYNELHADWMKFKQDPYWMVHEWNM